jgi:hypothetical protein
MSRFVGPSKPKYMANPGCELNLRRIFRFGSSNQLSDFRCAFFDVGQVFVNGRKAWHQV